MLDDIQFMLNVFALTCQNMRLLGLQIIILILKVQLSIFVTIPIAIEYEVKYSLSFKLLICNCYAI